LFMSRALVGSSLMAFSQRKSASLQRPSLAALTPNCICSLAESAPIVTDEREARRRMAESRASNLKWKCVMGWTEGFPVSGAAAYESRPQVVDVGTIAHGRTRFNARKFSVWPYSRGVRAL